MGAVSPLAERGDYLRAVIAGHSPAEPALFRRRHGLTSLVCSWPQRSATPRARLLAMLVLALDPARVFSRSLQLGQLGHSGENYIFD